jgi:hypothetical protein
MAYLPCPFKQINNNKKKLVMFYIVMKLALCLVFGSMDSGVERNVEGTLNGENWMFG